MREIRQSGSEGGAAFNSPSLPLSFAVGRGNPAGWDSVALPWGTAQVRAHRTTGFSEDRGRESG